MIFAHEFPLIVVEFFAASTFVLAVGYLWIRGANENA